MLYLEMAMKSQSDLKMVIFAEIDRSAVYYIDSV